MTKTLCWLGQQDSLDVGQDTSLGNGNTSQEFVQLFIVTDGKLKMTGNDARLLVVSGGIAGQFQNLGGQVFHDGSKVDGSTSANTFSVIS